MDKDLSDSDLQTSQDVDNNQSLVGKIKKNVSEIISITPLSKWFRKQNESDTLTVRRRQDDEDLQELQPPAKRTKLPSKETLSLDVSEALSPISVNNTHRSFPEPVAGPSGYQTQKVLHSSSLFNNSPTRAKHSDESVFKNPNNVVHVRELRNKECNSDSEESTSGYSSGRIGSKEVVSQESSKQTSPTENTSRKVRSLFQNSGLFSSDHSSQNSSLSSRAPSFNPSTFGSSSFADSTLTSKKLLNSPFYNGVTIYGGAAAYGRNTRRTAQDLQKVLRQSVSIKPANTGMERGNLQLGKTARRILDTLEQYSSPISDAKKIPVASKRVRNEGSLARYIGANPYTSRGASTRELQIPAVADSKLKQQKTKIQDSTEAARQIATKSINETYQIPVQRQSEKHVTKMKTKITSIRQRMQIDETLPEVNLIPISLPITELPKFDIPVPAPSQKPVGQRNSSESKIVVLENKVLVDKPQVMQKPVIEIEDPKLVETLEVVEKVTKPAMMEIPKIKEKPSVVEIETNKTMPPSPVSSEFKFSAPLTLAQYIKPLKSLNNFKFSEPLVKRRRSIHPELDNENSKNSDGEKAKKINGKTVNKVENIMETFKPKEGTWECSVCLIRNQKDLVRCAACETPKEVPKAPTRISNDLKPPALSFKPAEGTWECPTCMIRNKDALQKCAACEEKKPNSNLSNIVEFSLILKRDSISSASKPVMINTSFKHDAKFSNPPETWECPTCMIRNKNEDTKCVACETLKPGSQGSGFGSAFGIKDGEWECQVCMVRNKAEADKCQCCETRNPNGSNDASLHNSKISSFNFGIDKATAQSFTFGIPADTTQKMENTTHIVETLFGDKKPEPPSGDSSFTFGVPPKSTIESKDVAPTFSFGSKVSSAAPAAEPEPSFKFGTQQKKSEDVLEKAAPPTFSFGNPVSKSESSQGSPTLRFSFAAAKTSVVDKKVEEKVNPLLKPGEKLPEKVAPASGGFSFGLAKGIVSTSTTILPTSTATATIASFGQVAKKRSKPSDEETETSAKIPTFSFKSANGDVASKLPDESKSPAGSSGLNFSFGANSGSPSFTANQSDNLKQTFKFGQSSEPAMPANGFSFANITADAKLKSTSNFSFSSPKPAFNTPPKTGVFSFGATSSENKPAPFTFNAPSTEKPPTTNFNKSQSSFGFVQTPATPSFSFGGSQKQDSGFSSFGNGSSNNSIQQPLFGGSTVNGSFNFGASAAASNKAGFSFGASSGAGPASGGGFNFGSSTVGEGAVSSGGFNFSTAAPSFDATAAPTFNFTGGTAPTSFSAPPLQDGSTSQRRYKKAVRRGVR
ncbi:nuclear pore complex protein Nup153 [Euwallacea fornicatus]|uniref:nuclear pore complex protein Nup153 n=1 Tax=Euwallacea fornicatus TaxID=995702 RepID=UPI00338FEDBF